MSEIEGPCQLIGFKEGVVKMSLFQTQYAHPALVFHAKIPNFSLYYSLLLLIIPERQEIS